MNIKDRALDLLKQATTERSHYYVAATLKELLSEIERLERDLANARSDALSIAEAECLEVGEDADEAAKAKDATDYVAGYQDGCVDCSDAIRTIKEKKP